MSIRVEGNGRLPGDELGDRFAHHLLAPAVLKSAFGILTKQAFDVGAGGQQSRIELVVAGQL